MALTSGSKILIDEVNDAVKAFSVSGKTVTFTRLDGTTGKFTTQDTNTTYSAGTGISISSNKINNTGVLSVNGATGAVTGVVKSVNGVNADATGNVDAVSFMLPDYSAGVAISSGYKAPSAGVVSISLMADGNTTITLSINGIQMSKMVSGTNYYSPMISFDSLVSKDDTITWSAKYVQNANFFPLKGV